MAEITVDEITQVDLEGSAIFDKLMATTALHLQREFNNNRITGDRYAAVYTESISRALQQSVAYVLGRQAADKQASLLEEQIANAKNEKLLVAQKIITEKFQVQLLITGQELETLGVTGEAGVRLPDMTMDSIIEQQRLLAVSAVTLAGLKEDTERTSTVAPIGGLKLAEYNGMNAAALLSSNKAANEAAQLSTPTSGILLQTYNKALNEAAFIAQKTKTELAQINTQVDNVDVTGMLGEQRGLYAAQSKGFKADASQKTVKQMLDYMILANNQDATLVDHPNFVKTDATLVNDLITNMIADLG
jgi:hypothetical protein